MIKVPFQLGDSIVQAVVHQKHAPAPTMLNVHDDENTSVTAGLANLAEYGGRLIELVHSGDRLITFGLEGRKYIFDPNRIFSDAGITETLTRHSAYSPAAHAEIKAFASGYLKYFALDQEKIIFALHNITESLFSVEYFLPNSFLASDACAVHVSPQRSKFDFFYVTEKSFYDHLSGKDFNVVLQDNERVTEDGSLSVYFAKRGIPYINVEAEYTHLDIQIEMLKAVREMLGDVPVPA